MAAPGVSTLGVKFGWGAVGNSQPEKFTLLTRINSIGEINLDTETIDASALEDSVTRYVAGRADTGGTCDIVVNVTDETIAEWEAVFTASLADSTGAGLWFTVWSPFHAKGFFFRGQTPSKFPMPSLEQNALETVTIPLTITEYVGLGTKVEPAAST